MGSEYSIAVLLSSYNGEKYIRQQIDSILSQKLNHGMLDLFVRDDGSKDSTINIVNEYKQSDKRVHLIQGENEGYIKSFLDLLYLMKNSKAKYDYYSLADQDDVWDEDKLQIAVDTIRKNSNNKPFLYQATTRIVDENLNYLKLDAIQKKEITVYNSIVQTFSPGHTYVFNRVLLELVQPSVNADLLYGHDAYLTNLAVIKGTIYFDNKPHNDYRQHGNNQLGVSKNGVLGWIKLKARRALRGDGRKYAQQIRYFKELFSNDLNDEELNEIERFIKSESNILKRVGYALTSKLYRQGKLETIAFKLFYVLGGYKLE